MTFEGKRTLKAILHPYLFVLKEGGGIKNDFLDYSLMMLLINSSETIKSPHIKKPANAKKVSKMEINIPAVPTVLSQTKMND